MKGLTIVFFPCRRKFDGSNNLYPQTIFYLWDSLTLIWIQLEWFYIHGTHINCKAKHVFLHHGSSHAKYCWCLEHCDISTFFLSGFGFCEWMPSYLCCRVCLSLNVAPGKVLSPGCKRFWVHLQMSPILTIFRAGGNAYQCSLAGSLLGGGMQYSHRLETEQDCCDTQTMGLWSTPHQVTQSIVGYFIRLTRCYKLGLGLICSFFVTVLS